MKNEVIKKGQSLLYELDVEYYKAATEVEKERITAAMDATETSLEMIARAVFDDNNKIYGELMEVFNRSEKEIERFRSGQINVARLTGFLLGLLNRVDGLLYGFRSESLRN